MDVEIEGGNADNAEIIEAVADTVAVVLENQEASAEQSETISEMLVEAAIEGERGERIAEVDAKIDALREDFLTWQVNSNQSLSLQLAEAMAMIRQEMTETLLTLAAVPPSIPPLQEAPPILEENAVVLPEQVENPEPPPPPEKPKKRRLFL